MHLDLRLEAQYKEGLQQAKANEPLELWGKNQDKMLPPMWDALKDLMVEHINVFAWNHEDMLKLDNKVIKHSLCMNPNSKKVR